MTTSKENILSLLRTLLTFAGTFLIGHSLLNQPITSDVWDMIIGVSSAAFGTIWGIADKTATWDMIESGIRSVLIGAGGFLVTAGLLKDETLQAVIGLITPVLAFIQSSMSKAKVVNLATGKATPVVDKNTGVFNGKIQKAA